MKSGYEKQAAVLNMNGSDVDADAGIFAKVSEDELVKMGVSLISYFLHDEYVSRFRKMLTLEQFQNEELANFSQIICC